MLKMIARAAAPLLAATAIAQAADQSATGRVTYVDRAGGAVLIDNAVFHLQEAASLAGIRVGETIRMSIGGDGSIRRVAAGATAAKPSRTGGLMSVRGHVTYVDAAAGRVIIGNIPLTAGGRALASLKVGSKVAATYRHQGTIDMIQTVEAFRSSTSPLALRKRLADMTTSGRITFIDRTSGEVMVNNAPLRLPTGYDLSTLRLGAMIEARLLPGAGILTATKIRQG